jgi:hypothetical protein
MGWRSWNPSLNDCNRLALNQSVIFLEQEVPLNIFKGNYLEAYMIIM